MADAKIVIKGDSSNAVLSVKRLKTELVSLDAVAAKAMSFSFLGSSATIAALGGITKAAIDQGDALAKLQQKTGITVEELSKLQYAADLSGVSNEALEKSLISLAGGMVEASAGAGPMAEKYKALGISVRNTDGTMKTSRQVLGELADKFQAMPDGVDKTKLAVDIFGKKLGAEMIPTLNGGAAGLKAMSDEAEALGLVMTSDFAKASEEFNDNLDRLQKLAGSAGISIGNALIPSLNRLMTTFLEAKKAGGGFWESLNAIDSSANIEKRLSSINGQIANFNRLKAAGNKPLFGSYDDEIAALEKQQKILKAIQDKNTGDGVQSAQELAAKREGIERQLQAKLAEIAQLRGIAEGKISADILLDDDKRTAAQIKNAQALRDALAAAWKSSLTEAQAAGEAAKKLFEQSADVRQNGADKAAAKRRSALSPEDQQKSIQSDFSDAASAAEQAAGLALIASLHGRTENAAKLAAQASKDAERAAKLADQIDDPEAGARAIEQAAAIQANLLDQQAKAKQQEQKDLEERAAAQNKLITDLDKQLTDLQAKAAGLKVQADISAAAGALVELQAKLDNLKDKTITVTVNQVGSADAPLAGVNPDGSVPARAFGGRLPGRAPHDRADNMLYLGTPGEWVIQRPAVRFYGEQFMRDFNAMRIPKRAYGGPLVNNLSMPSITSRGAASPSSNTPINLYLDGHRVPVSASSDVAAELTTLFSRVALKRGARS